MQKPGIIKKRADFIRIANIGSRAKTQNLIVICAFSSLLSDVSVGFTASRRVGCAVLRNKAKRRLRELVRMFSGDFVGGCSFVFIATKDTPTVDFQVLKSDFSYCIKRSMERANAC